MNNLSAIHKLSFFILFQTISGTGTKNIFFHPQHTVSFSIIRSHKGISKKMLPKKSDFQQNRGHRITIFSPLPSRAFFHPKTSPNGKVFFIFSVYALSHLTCNYFLRLPCNYQILRACRKGTKRACEQLLSAIHKPLSVSLCANISVFLNIFPSQPHIPT